MPSKSLHPPQYSWIFINLKKAVLYILGTILSTCGMSLVLLNELGTNAMNTFFAAAAKTLDWQIATVFTLFNGMFLLVGFLLARKYIGIGSIFMIFIQGYCLNIWMTVFEGYPMLFIDFNQRIVVAAVGFFASQIGIALSTSMQLGTAGFEACLFSLADKVIIEYKYLKVISEIGYFTLALMFHGIFGVMTVVEMLLGGPCFSAFTILLNSTLLKWLNITDERNEMYRNSRKYRRQQQGINKNVID